MSTEHPLKEIQRSNTICPSPESVLLDAVRKNDTNSIKTLLSANPELLTSKYGHPYNKTILEIACMEANIEAKTVRTLLEFDDGKNEHTIPECIHLAVQNVNSTVLAVLLNHATPEEIGTIVEGDNALHALIKYGDIDGQPNEVVNCVKLLINSGIDVNQSDSRNFTPILLAAKGGMDFVVKALLNCGKHIDLDTHKWRNKSARQLIEEKKLYGDVLPEKANGYTDAKAALVGLLKENREDEFIEKAREHGYDGLVNLVDGNVTLLQMSCGKGLPKAVNYLIRHGANVNLAPNNGPTPLDLACQGGFYEIVDTLLKQPGIQMDPHIVSFLLKNVHNDKFPGIDHERCCTLVLAKLKANNVNSCDTSTNTPLHYAVRYSDEEKTLHLLEMGASLSAKNSFGVMPINDINPVLLEKHLDNCIKIDVNNKSFDKHDYEVIIDYTTLLPPNDNRTDLEARRNSSDDPTTNYFDETDVIFSISQSLELRHLLKHPVIVSFLYMKWQRIQWIFATNMMFFVTLVLALLTYMFTYYLAVDQSEFSQKTLTISKVSRIVLITCWVLLILRELFQMAILSCKYFKQFSNYLELCLVILIAHISFAPLPSLDTRKQIAAIVILLIAFDLILIMGQHPKCSANVVILKTVSYNFFKLLAWYALLILAFSLCFFILFCDKTGTEEKQKFSGPISSIFRTVVMLTGEFDAADINFTAFPFTSEIIFTLFIFMIVIILLNLLNGLAVCDIQVIKYEAEVVGLVTRTEYIRHVENIALGNILPAWFLRCVGKLCCCPWLASAAKRPFVLMRPFSQFVCLFHDPRKRYEIIVLPNTKGYIYTKTVNRRGKSLKPKRLSLCLDKEALRRIKKIVERKRRGVAYESALNNDSNVEHKLVHIVQRQNELNNKLNVLIDNMAHHSNADSP